MPLLCPAASGQSQWPDKLGSIRKAVTGVKFKSGLFDGILGVHAIGVASVHSLVPGDASLLDLSCGLLVQCPRMTPRTNLAKLHFDTNLPKQSPYSTFMRMALRSANISFENCGRSFQLILWLAIL